LFFFFDDREVWATVSLAITMIDDADVMVQTFAVAEANNDCGSGGWWVVASGRRRR
jgi:hypothetical protein